jgi:hypothetical protein
MNKLLQEFSLVSVSAINLGILIRYCWLLYHKQIKPALAMWLFFTIAVVMSMITYLQEGAYGIWDNILNLTDMLLVGTVTIAILIWGEKDSRMNRFDLICLSGVVLISFFWLFTQNHVFTHLAVQSIMVVAYFPVVRRLYVTRENTEAFSVWIMMLIAPMLALLSSKGFLATVYSVRAMICVGLLLLLMFQANYLSGQRE